MNRIECVDVFARLRGDAIVIVSPGYTGHELATAKHNEATIYNMDMPYSSPMCLGIALARPDQRVVALEGDGSMLMALGSLTTIGRCKPANLAVIVFDNRVYLTTGDGSVLTAGVDFAAIARAAGLDEPWPSPTCRPTKTPCAKPWPSPAPGSSQPVWTPLIAATRAPGPNLKPISSSRPCCSKKHYASAASRPLEVDIDIEKEPNIPNIPTPVAAGVG
ncbi:MAG TPA: thiamine pyrophosphate-dependent enzyme [Chloroflexota bacterium]